MINKIDYKKEFKEFYSGKRNEINIVNIDPMNFLTIKTLILFYYAERLRIYAIIFVK